MCKQHRDLFISISYFFIMSLLIVPQVRGDCETPWGAPGQCVLLKDCPKLNKILEMEPQPAMSEKIIEGAICGIDGFNYKVCCATALNTQTTTTPRTTTTPTTTTATTPPTTTTPTTVTTTTTTTAIDINTTTNTNPTTTESPQVHEDNTNESCISPAGRRGNCVNIKECATMMNPLEQKPMSEEKQVFLQLLTCGYEGIDPKVCCEIEEDETEENQTAENLDNSGENQSVGTKENTTGDDCISYSGKKGNCIDIRKCPKLINLLQHKPLTLETRSYIRNLQCGGNHIYPKVCCDGGIETPEYNCVTPWGRMGQCIPINDCEDMKSFQSLKPLPAWHEKFLENARCNNEKLGDSKLKVCCRVKYAEMEKSFGDSQIIREGIVREFPNNHGLLRLLPHDDCGHVPQSRIVGGNETKLHEFPWMALLGYSVARKGIEFRCGGSVISERYVLTAAHCVTALPIGMKLIKARLGEYDIQTKQDCDDTGDCTGRYKEFEVESTKAHEDYSELTFQNDIGLVKLRSSIDFHSGYIRPICLPLDPRSSTPVQETPNNAVVTGWGITESGTNSMRLRKVTLPILTNKLCQRTYKHNKKIVISPKQLCAGGTRNKDSCSGDSGGPLQAIGMYDNRPSFLQYGIVSYGHESCGTEGYPGIYTSVAHYVEWIVSNMSD